MRYVWQIGDLMVGSESAFSVDKLHHTDALSWERLKARRPLLLSGSPCKSHACWSSFSVCALVLSRLCSSVCPTAPLAPCLCALVFDLRMLLLDRISLCHVTAVSLFGVVLSCPVLQVAVQKFLTALQ